MPPREPQLYLHEVREACDAVLEYARNRSFQDYTSNQMMRHAIERNLAVIGEALSQLRRLDDSLESRLPELRRIIDFRNLLVHGYFKVEHATVWAIVEADVPQLRIAVDRMLQA